MTRLILAVFLFAASSLSLNAKESNLVIGAGAFEMVESTQLAIGLVSYEMPEQENFWGIRPHTLVFFGEDSRYYAGLGGIKTWNISDSWEWGLSSMAGYYHPGTKGSEAEGSDALGYDVEFYSRIFVNYKLAEDHRVRLEFGHISNASLGDKNPGSESLVLSWVIGL